MRAPTAGLAHLLLSRPALVSCLGSLSLLLSCSRSPTRLLPLLACLGIFTTLLSCFVPAPVSGSPAVLLLFPMLDPTSFHLAFIALRTFKQALSDELLRRHLTSPI